MACVASFLHIYIRLHNKEFKTVFFLSWESFGRGFVIILLEQRIYHVKENIITDILYAQENFFTLSVSI